MGKIENPSRQLNYLQQCLSSDKKPLGLFLGAGCPMAVRVGTNGETPLIPDIAGITALVRTELANCGDCGPLWETIEEHFKTDRRLNPTIEDVLTHIRALRAVAGRDEVRRLSAEKLDRLDHAICEIIHKVADRALPSADTPYHGVASWVDAVRRDNPVEVFTTNYDLLMEQAFEDVRVPYFDGFAGARKPFFDLRAMEEDMLPPRWARLWKLHGSVNWYQVPEGVCRGIADRDGATKRVIHPSHLKYQESRRMPYLAMIDRLRAFLKRPSATLILCGYSFRDEHINEVILQGLESAHTATSFALCFDVVATYPQAAAMARRRPNLSVLTRDGGIISAQEIQWPGKDPEAAPTADTRWVNWSSVTEGGTQSAEFALGDFAVFGQFLQELAGAARRPEATSGQ